MKKLLNRIFWFICRCLLGFRYRTRVNGLQQLAELKGPTLVLPNHPAYIDPAIVSANLRLHQPLRPLVFSGTYRMPFLRPLMALVDAFEVPDMSAQSRDAQAKALEMIDGVVERLNQGDCMLIYPSGRLQRGDTEKIGANRATFDIISRCPNLNIVLVRTRGVWGSIFSCAETGAPPNLASQVFSALRWVIASCFFFLPRRDVELSVEVIQRNLLPLDSKHDFNSYLEAYYNADGPQTPKFVRFHHLFGPETGHFGKANPAGNLIDANSIRPKTIEGVNHLVEATINRPLTHDENEASTPLENLGLDSLDRMDLALKIEEQFGFRSNKVAPTLGGLWALADGQAPSDDETDEKISDAWFEHRSEEPKILADTIAKAFVERALRSANQLVLADGLSGLLTYRKFLVAAHLMARQFSEISAARVGIMLPASAAADLAFIGLHLAGKTPVMMNWTTGPANLKHAVRVTEISHIITSKKMIDRLNIECEGADYLFLEDVKSRISKFDGLKTLLATYLFPKSFQNRLPKQNPSDPAVYLFTSGSESLPKTVPLSHRNLLVNVEDGLEVLQPDATDSLLGFLPPFHSFGMTGNLLLPLLSGVRCVRFADPTDAQGLVRTIVRYRPSMIFTTPTFLGYILAAAKEGDLTSLKKIITGAEKCPPQIFERCQQQAPEAIILEGYGITECSPVVAANRIGQTKLGTVGFPVKHVETCIYDMENQRPVSPGETGMLLVTGPSIFDGYLNHDGPSPFVTIDNRSWYKTGDLVSEDEEGYLHFQGRLKRFLKAGGEMISLPALEEPIAKAFPADEDGPKVAVEGIETPDGRHIVLFTTLDISLRQASDLLIQAGLKGVMRLDEVQQIEAIPVLGTGKTDYKQLRSKVVEQSRPPAEGVNHD